MQMIRLILFMALAYAGLAANYTNLSNALSLRVGDVLYIATPAGGACATSDSTNSWNILREGWTGSSEENTWTFYNGGAGRTDYVINPNADTSEFVTNKPPGACNEAISVMIVATNANFAGYFWDYGSTLPTNISFTAECYVLFKTNNLGNMAILSVGTGTSPNTERRVALMSDYSSGSVKLAAYGVSTSSYVSVSTNQWNYVKIFTDSAGATNGSYVIINSTSNNFTRAAFGSRYVHVGALSYLTVGDKTDYCMDVICVNTNAP